MKLAPERTTGWGSSGSFSLHEIKRTQEAYADLKPTLDNEEEAQELLGKAIELGGDAVKTQALNDPDLQGM